MRPDGKPEPKQIGKYKIFVKVGQGAMGEVYKAHDPVLGRFVAIKTISQGISSEPQARERFHREARSAAALNHPNIITVFDFGEEEGTIYMAMELLEGTDLREAIEKRHLTKVTEKLAVMEQICDGLAFAHSKGVVHRDLKPGNIHILPNGQVKIMDFGLARRSQDADRTAVIMGTPYYMAPEQAQGERATPRSDIFALGALFYELLSGRRAFPGDTIPAVLFSVVHREPEPLTKWKPDAPPALVAVIERALAKDPAWRYQDAGEMREALRSARDVLFGAPPGTERPPAGLQQEPARPLPVPLSEAPETDAELKEALLEMEQYLTDRLPPLMVVDSVTRVMGAPPGAVAAEIYTWAKRQAELQSAQLGDLLFHALRKLHVMGEFRLLEPEALAAFLGKVGEAALEYCPPEQRTRLRKSLTRLNESEMVRTGPIGMMHVGPGVAEEIRRLGFLEQRLQQEDARKPVAEDDTRSLLVSQTLTVAANQAANERELEDHLRRLSAFGVASGTDQVFRSIGQGLPGTVLPPEVVAAAAQPAGAQVEAMRRIIALAEEPIEMARRFRHLVYAALEQFNGRNLGRAVQMFELAIQLGEEKKIDPGFVETVRRKGHESIDQASLRHFQEKHEYHPQLRMVLNFFHFGLGPAALLDELQVEQRRERRRFLLDLLEVHGEAARRLARERLAGAQEGGDESGFHIQRNWIYLMRTLPRPADQSAEDEIDLVAHFATPGHPPFLVREAVTHLGQTKHLRAKQKLVDLLAAYEAECSPRPGTTAEKLNEWHGALDKICGALARFGTPSAWSAVLDHALARRPHLGSTMSRLSEVSSQDLSGSPEILARLFAEMRNLLPRGVLSFLASKKDHDLLCLVEAVSGTRSEEVRAALEDLAQRFPSQAIGQAAVRVLDRANVPPATASQDQEGELDVFLLPSLLHRLAQSRATGSLILSDQGGARLAALILAGGRLRACRYGRLEGASAVYQLVERPFAGTYLFQGGAAASGANGPALPEVSSLLVEAVRRAGELQRASALVPADARLEATGSSPSPVPDEPDYDLVVALWEKACAGVPPRQMEADLAVDSFRVHRPLAHWLEEGALRLA